MKLSYLITCKTENIRPLVERILKYKDKEDNIVILVDYNRALIPFDLIKLLGLENFTNNGIYFVSHNLDNDYGHHKNAGIAHCGNDTNFIFQIDADELPSETLLLNIKDIIAANPTKELFFIPRINDFQGVTETHAKQWGWKLTPSNECNGRNVVNFPDHQGRIFRRNPNIQWAGRLHERIQGHAEHAFLPTDQDLYLLHTKTIEKQIETNLRYNQQFTSEENQGHQVV